jgi:hypothetical protein
MLGLGNGNMMEQVGTKVDITVRGMLKLEVR